MSVPPAPGVQFRPWFSGRDPAIAGGDFALGGIGAADLVPMVPVFEPISAGRPPVAPALPAVLEIDMEPVTSQAMSSSGRRVTRSMVLPGGAFGAGQRVLWRVVVELEWGPMTFEEWSALKSFLLSPDLVGLTRGGAARAMTIDIDGEGLTDSAVEVRLLGGVDVIEQVEQVEAGPGGSLYRLGPLRAEEVL